MMNERLISHLAMVVQLLDLKCEFANLDWPARMEAARKHIVEARILCGSANSDNNTPHRDRFACAAMQALVPGEFADCGGAVKVKADRIAGDAYLIADAMLSARETANLQPKEVAGESDAIRVACVKCGYSGPVRVFRHLFASYKCPKCGSLECPSAANLQPPS